MLPWLAYSIVIIVLVLLFITLPPQVSTPLFVLLVLVSIGTTGWVLVQRGRRRAVTASADEDSIRVERAPQVFEHSAPQRQAAALSRSWRQALMLTLAIALLYIGQAMIHHDPQDVPTSTAWVFIFVGLAIFFVILQRAAPADASPATAPATAQSVTIRWRWLLVSMGLSAFVAWRSILRPHEAYLFEHLLLWLLSMLALVMAFSPSIGQTANQDTAPLRRWEYGLIPALLVVAVLLRATNLEGNPPVLDQDEANFAAEGAGFIGERFLITPFEPGWHSHPRLYQSMIGLSNVVFGFTKTGARVPSALLGALGVVAAYLLGREMIGWRGGLVAALFMASWYYHVQLSRLALNESGDPLFATLAFYSLLRGLRRGAPTDYVLSGISLGLAQFFYLGGRLAIPVMVAYVFFIWLREREVIARQWRLLLLVPLAALIVTWPQNHLLLYFGEPFTTRTEINILAGGQLQEVVEAGEDVGQYLLNQVRGSFVALFQINDRSLWVAQSTSLLGVFGGPLLLIGTIISLFVIWQRPRWSLALGWAFAVIFIGSTLSISPPQYQRYFPSVSAYAILVAIGALAVAFAISHVLRRPSLENKLVIGLGALLFVGNLWFYYGVYVPDEPFLASRENWTTNAVAQEMVAATDAGRQVLLVSEYATGIENTTVVQYFMMNREYSLYNEAGLDDLDRARPLTAIIAPEQRATLSTIRQHFPGGALRQVHLAQDGTLGYLVYEWPPPSSAAE